MPEQDTVPTGISRRDLATASVAVISGLAAPKLLQASPGQSSANSAPSPGKDRKFVMSDGLRNATHDGERGYVVKVRLPDYRSLPLSCIVSIDLMVDGQQIDPDSIVFRLNSYSHKLAELPRMSQVTWWVLDAAELFVPKSGGLTAGEHEVEGTLAFLLPYATAGAITLRATAKRRLTLEPAA